MNLLSHKWIACWTVVAAAIAVNLPIGERAIAADDDATTTSSVIDVAEDRLEIKPYEGPPVYLEESQVVAPPTLVSRSILTDNYPDGQVRFERQIARYSDDHREADGLHREYYPNGQLFAEGQYQRGRRHGAWTFYHDNGTVNRQMTYNRGLPEGEFEVFRADGTRMAKRSFGADGLRSGDWLTYDETGEQQLTEEHYQDGKADGVWKAWYPSGQTRREIGFKNGVQDGLTIEWNEDGTKRGEVPFVEGKKHGTATVWLPDGRKIVQKYEDDRVVSRTIE